MTLDTTSSNNSYGQIPLQSIILQEDTPLLSDQKQKFIKKQVATSLLIQKIKSSHSPVMAKKLHTQLAENTTKLSHLIKNQFQVLTENERLKAVTCLENAQVCLSTKEEKTDILNESIDRPSWLRDDITVSAKLAVHILGDSFAKAADLEGGATQEMLSYSLNCLEKCPDFMKEADWKSLVELLENANIIEREIFRPITKAAQRISNIIQEGKKFDYPFDKDMAERIDLGVKKLSDMICEAMDNKKEFLIPGGWIGESSGHALYYKIVPQPNGKCSFQIYNRGAGLQFHGKIKQDFKSLYQAFVTYEDIKRENLLNPRFLKGIIEQQSFICEPFSRSSSETNYNESDIYESLIELLGGHDQGKNVEMEDLMSEQRSGTCAWKSLTAVKRGSLGYVPSKKLKLRMEVQAVWSYQLGNPDLSQNVFSRNLLARLITSAAETLHISKELISEKEFMQLSALLLVVETQVIKAERQGLKEQALVSESMPIASEPLKLLSSTPETQIELYNRYPLLFPSKYSFSILKVDASADISTSKSVQKDVTLRNMLNVWEPKPDTLCGDLQEINNFFKKMLVDGKHEEVNHIFLEIIRRLPMPTSDLSTEAGLFWNMAIEQNVDKIPELMAVVAQLTGSYYSSCFYIEGSAACPPARTYALIKSLHIQNILKLHSPLATVMGLTMPVEFAYLEQIYSEGWKREMGFRTTDPLIQEELSGIYKDLQKMAAPFAINEGVITFRQTGLPFEIFNVNQPDMCYFCNEMATNSVLRQRNLSPEFVYIQKKLKEDRDYFEKAAESYKKYDLDNKENSWLRAKGKAFKDLESNEQIAHVYCHGGEELLPTLFLQWRSQVIQSRLLLYGPFAPPISHKIQGAEELVSGITYHMHNESVMLSYKSPLALTRVKIDYHLSSHQHLHERYLPNLRPITLKPLLKLIEYWSDHPKCTQNEVYSTVFPEINHPLQQVREILSLGTNKKLQVEQTVAFFTSNIHLLSSTDNQSLFYLLLFEEDFLLRELQHSPEMISHLDKLIKHGYGLAYDSAEIETCVFYINLSRHLKSFVAYVYPDRKNNDFLPIQSSLNEILAITGLIQQDKSMLYSELLASYASAESITDHDVIMIIRALTFLSIHPVPVETMRPDVKQEQIDAVEKFKYVILAIGDKKEDHASEVINKALASIIPDYRPGLWKLIAPSIFKSDEEYVLNVLNGDFFEKNHSKTSLPNAILSHPDYKLIFSKKYGATKINFNTYEFLDQHDYKYRIIKGTQPRDIIFQREIDGKWHQKVDYSTVKLMFNAAIGNYHICWFCAENSRIEMYDPRNSVTPFSYAISTDIQEKTINNEGKETTLDLVDFKRYPDAIFSKELVWTSPSILQHSTLHFLTSFEDFSFINVWRDVNEIPSLIELPRYNLTFKLHASDSKKSRWVCSSLGGFHLAESQFVPSMGNLKGYLVLENKNGEKLIILPLHMINPKSSVKNLTFSETIDFDRAGKETEQRYVSYNLKNKGSSGQLVVDPANTEACLYLA
ncbi:MAG TPA: hypothetical protein VGP47_05065, partial [Parachlamydiaceae bacterium]|nr:hypothetical protein [Parachlamydiaceae bacterium]